MPRLPRLCVVGVAQHVIQRGNNRQICFGSESDFAAYVHWLKKYADKFNVDIHAWVFMTNHVHLLVTPYSAFGVSKMMQSLGRNYVQYFNYEHKRSGTLWEGRFRSCLIESEGYLLECYKYIELNPVRAAMVDSPAEYKWSSYTANAHGQGSTLIKPHEVYSRLGGTVSKRQEAYRALFHGQVNKELIETLRVLTHTGMVIGSEKFKEQLEAINGLS